MGLWVLFLLALVAGSGAKSREITAEEILAKKESCLGDVTSGLWGWECIASDIATTNCALRCVSADCYSQIYGDDPLEEGEIDKKRGREFKDCVKRESRGEDISHQRSFLE